MDLVWTSHFHTVVTWVFLIVPGEYGFSLRRGRSGCCIVVLFGVSVNHHRRPLHYAKCQRGDEDGRLSKVRFMSDFAVWRDIQSNQFTEGGHRDLIFEVLGFYCTTGASHS